MARGQGLQADDILFGIGRISTKPDFIPTHPLLDTPVKEETLPALYRQQLAAAAEGTGAIVLGEIIDEMGIPWHDNALTLDEIRDAEPRVGQIEIALREMEAQGLLSSVGSDDEPGYTDYRYYEISERGREVVRELMD